MPEELFPIEGSPCAPLPGSCHRGHTHPSEPIEVDLTLRHGSHEEGGLPEVWELAAQRPHERAHLSREDFTETHGAAQQDVDKVESFAHERGLSVHDVDYAHRTVTLLGPAEAMSGAFGIQLLEFDHRHAPHRGHWGAIHLPSTLIEAVESVHGLDTRPAAHPKSPVQSAAPPGSTARAFFASEVAKLYDFPQDLDGSGVSVGLIEMGGGFKRSTLEGYFANVTKSPLPKVKWKSVAGGVNNPTGPAAAEVNLDIQVLGGIAPGAEQVVYIAPNTNRGFLKAVKQAVHDKQANAVLSVSWGGSEFKDLAMYNRAMNQALHEAALLGITVCAATGDYGSGNQSPPNSHDGLAHVNFPASSPYVLACGGTTLFAEGTEILSEFVWHGPGTGASTGGGVSALFGPIHYQSEVPVPRSVNAGDPLGRGVPDVAGNANPATGYLVGNDSGKVVPIGGTSAATPLWAALIAMMVQKVGKPVGLLNPWLYELAAQGRGLRSIEDGNNVTAQAGGYFAGPRWNACTGLGCPKGQEIVDAAVADGL